MHQTDTEGLLEQMQQSRYCILNWVFMNNEEHIYKNISLILFSKGAHSLLLVER